MSVGSLEACIQQVEQHCCYTFLPYSFCHSLGLLGYKSETTSKCLLTDAEILCFKYANVCGLLLRYSETTS